MMNQCRCGHPQYQHWDWNDNCIRCPCPEYRPAETRTTQTMKGTSSE